MVARLAGLLPGELSEEQAAVYRAISGGPRAAGPQVFALTDGEGRRRTVNAMLLSPPVGAALQAVGTAVRYESLLSDRVREMAVLLVAAHWGSASNERRMRPLDAHAALPRTSSTPSAAVHCPTSPTPTRRSRCGPQPPCCAPAPSTTTSTARPCRRSANAACSS